MNNYYYYYSYIRDNLIRIKCCALLHIIYVVVVCDLACMTLSQSNFEWKVLRINCMLTDNIRKIDKFFKDNGEVESTFQLFSLPALFIILRKKLRDINL